MARVNIMENQELKLIASNKLPDALPLKKLVFHEQVNGQWGITFAVPSNHPDSSKIKSGDWAIVKDIDGVYRAFVIIEEAKKDDNQESLIEFYTEELAVNELNDHIVEDKRPTNTNARTALDSVLAGSLWVSGTVDNLGTASTNIYYESAMEGIKKIIENWGGEVRFRVTIGPDNKITGRYVDLLSRLGQDTGKRFEWGKDIDSVEQFVDIKPLKTALYGRGKGEETDSGGYGRRITFKDVVWTTPTNPVNKPAGQEWVGDPTALAQYGHLNPDGTRRHRYGVFIDEEETDPAKLLQKTWDHLQSIKEPSITFRINVVDLEQVSAGEYKHEAVRIGDTVYVIIRRNGWDTEVQARVLELDRDMLEPENTEVTIGNVLHGITDLIKDVQTQVEKKLGRDDPIGWLKGIIDAARAEFHSLNGYVYITDQDGILITNRPKDNIDNPPDKAIQIKAGGLAISSSRNPDGTWNWSTFVLGDQVIADRINSGRIRTDVVQVGDDSGKVLISGGNVTIKGGGLEIYSTLDAVDNGVLIKGNKIFTNFVKNPDFDLTPNATYDWSLSSGVRYDSTNKIIVVDTDSSMVYKGIDQYIDIYHPRATIQALFKCNLFGGSTAKKVRIYIYTYDSLGNRLADRFLEDQFATFQDWLLLNYPVEFPPGTVRIRLWVQVEMKYAMTAGMEIHWVKASYDEWVTQKQLDMYPRDVYNVHSKPEIQAFTIDVTNGATVKTAGTVVLGQRVTFDRAFTDPGPEGSIVVQLTPHDSNSVLISARPYAIDKNGFTMHMVTHRDWPANTTISVAGIAYRIGYIGQLGFSV